jgi:RNA polymerase sigma factor (sigma-70 family)
MNLRAGEEAALNQLHRRYWSALVELARARLRGTPGRCVDEEDIAQQAFWAFYQSLRAGRLPRLTNRHEFLALLTHIIACKAVNQIEQDATRKRGGQPPQALRLADLAALADGARTPLEDAVLRDCYQHYLDRLPDGLRPIAELYLASYTHREIAEQLGCVERTVERKIARILARWQEMAAQDVGQELR